MEELKKSRGSATLFHEAEGDTFPARRSREQFERYLVPLFTALLFLLQSGAVWGFWKWLDKAAPLRLDHAPMAMALYALFALILFLLGQYSSGLARLGDQRLLRAGAGYLVLGIVVGEVGRIEASEHAFPHRALDLLGGHPSVERVGDDQLQVLDAGARGHLDHLLDDQLADVRSFHRRERDRYVVERDRQPHPCPE